MKKKLKVSVFMASKITKLMYHCVKNQFCWDFPAYLTIAKKQKYDMSQMLIV